MKAFEKGGWGHSEVELSGKNLSEKVKELHILFLVSAVVKPLSKTCHVRSTTQTVKKKKENYIIIHFHFVQFLFNVLHRTYYPLKHKHTSKTAGPVGCSWCAVVSQ